MNLYTYLYIIILLTTTLFSNNEEIAFIDELKGTIILKPIKGDLIPRNAIVGRSLYNGDIINSNRDGSVQIIFSNTKNKILLVGLSELQIKKENNTYQLILNYGNILTQFSNMTNNDYIIFTQNSQINSSNSEIWLTRNLLNEDKIYTLLGDINIFHLKNLSEKNIGIGKMIISNSDSLNTPSEFNNKMLPSNIYNYYQENVKEKRNNLFFTVMNYFSEDSSIQYIIEKNEPKQKKINLKLQTGLINIEKNSYVELSLNPIYIGKNLYLGYNLTGFIATTDSSKNLNLYSSISNILTPLELKYTTKNKRYNFKIGKIKKLSFGYGILLKRYTNSINYPIKQDAGLLIDYKSDAGNITYQIFNSSIGELIKNGGIIGLYATIKRSAVKFGIGIVNDLNQFSSVPDSIWNNVSPKKRSINGYQFNVTYELKSSLRNDTYLFSEFSTINYPNDLRFIRIESNNIDTAKQGFQRKSSIGILGPGIWWKIGHHRNIKIAPVFSSSLHILPFFSETYNLERFYYIPKSMLDTLDHYILNSIDDKWNNMITENNIDIDSTAYLLSKDVYSLLNPTKNVHNKIGFYLEYNYQFRNYYSYSIDFTILKEINTIESPTTYYTIGGDLSINEGLIKGISEFKLYYNQYFTDMVLDHTIYNTNIILGSSIEFNILQNMSMRIYNHDVFYDNNLDGNINNNSTFGIGIRAKL